MDPYCILSFFVLQDLFIWPLATLQTRVQKYPFGSSFARQLLFLLYDFLVFYLPCQYWFCLGQLLDLVPEDLVSLFHLENCCHQLVHVTLVRGCGQYKVIECGGYVPDWYHIICAMISRLFCAHILGEIEVVICIHKYYWTQSTVFCLFIFGVFLHSFKALA